MLGDVSSHCSLLLTVMLKVKSKSATVFTDGQIFVSNIFNSYHSDLGLARYLLLCDLLPPIHIIQSWVKTQQQRKNWKSFFVVVLFVVLFLFLQNQPKLPSPTRLLVISLLLWNVHTLENLKKKKKSKSISSSKLLCYDTFILLP